MEQQRRERRTALDLFPDGEHVRLQSHDRRGLYLHAAEDGEGVYLSRRRATLNQEWQVFRVDSRCNTFVLLYNSASGRYLRSTDDAGPHGHIGKRVVQGAYDEGMDLEAFFWVPMKPATGDNNVLLQHIPFLLLRANGKYFRWRTGVTVDDDLNEDTMTHWVVEAIPPRASSLHPEDTIRLTEKFRDMNKFLQRQQQCQQRTVMELFPDGEHVRLRSRDRRGMNLHAAEDGVGVYLSPRRASLNQVWQVVHVKRDGHTFILLLNAAYSRYLKATDDAGPRGHIGQRVVQGAYNDEQDLHAISWIPVRAATGDNNVLLQPFFGNRLLRANGKNLWWRTDVTVDGYSNADTMTHWVVEAIPPTPAPLYPSPFAESRPGLLCGTAPVVEQRTIRYVQAANDASFDPDGWTEIHFQGRCSFKLRQEMAKVVSQGIVNNILMCIRAGNMGALIPLVAALPQNEDPIDVIILSIWAPVADELRYPDMDA